jgi:acyl-CoA reductase-like NAD-dependent aldehyde dehydrogenase
MSAEPVPANALPLHHSWIGNAAVVGRAGTRDSVNPSTGAAWAQASLLDAAQASDAIAAAEAAFPGWSSLTFQERGQVLLRARDLITKESDALAALIQREQGKPAVEAFIVELFPAMEHLKHLALHAEELLADEPVEARAVLLAHKECRLAYTPFGVVLVVTPWNYPFGISISGVATALAAGNTVVLKPAPATTVVGLRIGELFRDAGLPAGALNVIAVDDALAPGLVADPRVRKIVFTGSVATGKRVMETAARNLTPVVLELGGKDPAIVCADADLDRAAEGIAWGAFVNCGQTCASVERVYVEAAVAEPFLAKLVARVAALRVGDPAASEVEVGPMTMERQRRIVEEHVQDAVARGAKALTGGVRPQGPGYFYPPTVLTGVTQDMRIVREETFGPVLPVMTVASVDEAIRLANDSEYGLTASGWTRDPELARKLQSGLRAGVVSINDHLSSYGEPTAPWGGFRASGIGRAHGAAGIREMVQVKYVTEDDTRGPSIWWYPYDRELAGLVQATRSGLYGRGFFTRVGGLLKLGRFGRFWRRGHLTGMAGSADRLID